MFHDHDAFGRQELREGFDVAHAILQGHDEGGRTKQRAEESRQGGVGGGLERHHDQVAGPDRGGFRRGCGAAHDALRSFIPEGQSVPVDHFVVAAGEAAGAAGSVAVVVAGHLMVSAESDVVPVTPDGGKDAERPFG